MSKKNVISIYCEKHQHYKRVQTVGKNKKHPICDECRRIKANATYWEKSAYANWVDALIDNDIEDTTHLEIIGDGCYYSKDRRKVYE